MGVTLSVQERNDSEWIFIFDSGFLNAPCDTIGG